MRTALVAASALAVALAGQAAAADLPVAPAYRAAPIVVPYNWNGYYIGANVGWSRAQSNVSFAANPAGFPADAASINTASTKSAQRPTASPAARRPATIGNGAISCRRRGGRQLPQQQRAIAGGSVASAVSARDHAFGNGAAFVAGDSAPAARLRLGQLAGVRHRRLGHRQGHVHGWVVPTAGAPVGTSTSRTKNGWTVGGGVEYGLIGGWSAKLEYLYVRIWAR